MAFELELPKELKAQGWKVKIRDKERVEPPHATVMRKTSCWRFGLRENGFLDRQPPPGDVDDKVLKRITESMDDLIKRWDAMYPHNPVKSNDN
jgi:hypothetical protein